MRSADKLEIDNSRSGSAATNFTYDLAVAYRIYPKVSKPAQTLPFGNDKLRQAETCLHSFRAALGSLRVKVWVLLDGCPPEYRAIFQNLFAVEDLVLIDLDRVGNRATFSRQMDILLSQQDAEFVYFAEDDYLYLADQFERALSFIREQPGVDFVSLYDHFDCYSLDIHHEPKWLRVHKGHHWRTASSTCLTFLTRQNTLARYERVFRTYCQQNDDCALWLSLTKRRVFDPLAALRYFRQRQFYRNVLVKAWMSCWRQIFFGKTAKLWVPIPGIATHLSAGLLSPGIDWIPLMEEDPASNLSFDTFLDRQGKSMSPSRSLGRV